MEILCIGSAVMDITGWPIDQTQSWKEKQRISDIRIQPGGDAVNQCAALAALYKNPAWGLTCSMGRKKRTAVREVLWFW